MLANESVNEKGPKKSETKQRCFVAATRTVVVPYLAGASTLTKGYNMSTSPDKLWLYPIWPVESIEVMPLDAIVCLFLVRHDCSHYMAIVFHE